MPPPTLFRFRPAFPETLPGAGEGIRTPDPLITNQMLYQLSYASELRLLRARGTKSPPDPFLMSGTIIKSIITAIDVQPTTTIFFVCFLRVAENRPELLTTCASLDGMMCRPGNSRLAEYS